MSEIYLILDGLGMLATWLALAFSATQFFPTEKDSGDGRNTG